MILDEILVAKRQEVAAAKSRLPLEELKGRVKGPRATRGFNNALQDAPAKPALIAELKRKSPSKGMLRERFDPVRLAQEMQEAGASALSVLTDERYFGGCLDFLRDAQQFTDIPILRKDFIIDAYQLYEAAVYQADAVLLITQVLGEATLREYIHLAGQLGLDALVEVHAEDELDQALKAGATLIGINTRDLRTFTMHPDAVERLRPRVPSHAVLVAESGIQSREDIQRLKRLRVDAVLIGESLMTAPEPAAKIRELFEGTW